MDVHEVTPVPMQLATPLLYYCANVDTPELGLTKHRRHKLTTSQQLQFSEGSGIRSEASFIDLHPKAAGKDCKALVQTGASDPLP